MPDAAGVKARPTKLARVYPRYCPSHCLKKKSMIKMQRENKLSREDAKKLLEMARKCDACV